MPLWRVSQHCGCGSRSGRSLRMKSFNYQRPTEPADAIHAGSIHGTKFLAGGTNLLDLMKYGVESPTTLIDITRLDLTQVTSTPEGGVSIGALVRNADLANHPLILAR